MHQRLIDNVKYSNLIMKILKIIFILSFLCIGGVNEKMTSNSTIILASIYGSLEAISSPYLHLDVFWFISAILTVCVLILVYRSKVYKERYLLVFYSFVLAVTTIYYSEILYYKATPYFIVTSTIFVISSLALIIRSFKPLDE